MNTSAAQPPSASSIEIVRAAEAAPAAVPEPGAQQGSDAPFSPPPCFYWKWCSQRAALNKCGRSVCRSCAATLRGTEYALRDPSRDRRNLFRLRALVASAQLDSELDSELDSAA